MSSGGAIDRIVRANKRRHDHWQEQTDHCPCCGSFVSLDDVGTTAKGVCPQCGKAIHRYKPSV